LSSPSTSAHQIGSADAHSRTPGGPKTEVLQKQHELNMKQIDIKRKENRAEFHIKQRDNIIEHLKE